MSAAECHGLATGILCADDRAEAGFWLDELSQEASFSSHDHKESLQALFEDIRASLMHEDYGFALLLPDDDTALSGQLDALRSWCQGFLYGLGFSPQAAAWSEEARELIKDIIELTKLETDAEGEAAENDFMEITEYLRAAVLFLRTELNSGQNNTVH